MREWWGINVPFARTQSKSHMKGLFVGENSLISLDFIGQYWTNKNPQLACKANRGGVLVEMGESRTPRPNEPIGEYTTGLVDVLFNASDSHRQDSSALVLWS